VSGDFSVHELKVIKEGCYTFAVSQVGDRMFTIESDYSYSNARMALVKARGSTIDEGVTYVKGCYDIKQRDTYLECENLEEGNYFLLSEIDWVSEEFSKSFSVNSYGPAEVEIVDLEETVTRRNFLEAMCRSLVDLGHESVKTSPNENCEDIVVHDLTF